jgi:peroxiredoxin
MGIPRGSFRPRIVRLAIVLATVALLMGPIDALEGVRAEPAATTEATPGATPEATAGLAVGEHAPDFTLPDQHGTTVSLSALLEHGPVAVVFHRSVDWCVYCKLQMVQLQRIRPEIEAAGGQVVAISYDPVEKLQDFAARTHVDLPLLSDVDSRTIDAYGVRATQAPPESSGFALHATFVVDRDGVIRTKLFQLSYQERPAIETLIDALKAAATPSGGRP